MKNSVTLGPAVLAALAFAPTDEAAGRLVRSVLAYLRDGVGDLPEIPSVKAELERQIAAAEIHRNCGSLGGRPKTKNNQNKTKTKPKENQNKTKIESRAQEETSSLMEENLPSLSKENRLLRNLKETPPPPPSEPTDFALVAEPVAQPTQPAAKAPRSKPFRKPDVFEVAAYCKERGNNVDAQTFVDFYESKGWMIGKNPMKDWKAAVRTWERQRNTPPSTADPTKFYNPEGTGTDWSKLGQTYGSSPITTPQTF